MNTVDVTPTCYEESFNYWSTQRWLVAVILRALTRFELENLYKHSAFKEHPLVADMALVEMYRRGCYDKDSLGIERSR